MSTWEFTLTLAGTGHLGERAADAVYEATGGDASIEHGPRGIFAAIDRESSSLASAIASAVQDIESVPGLRVTGVRQDDLVTLADIASRAGRTYESVRLLATGKRGPGGFPAPVHDSGKGHVFYSWAQVARWLRAAVALEADVPPAVLRIADEILRARSDLAEASEAAQRELRPLLSQLAS